MQTITLLSESSIVARASAKPAIRRACHADRARLQAMHRAAMTELARAAYAPAEIEGFLADVQTVDPVLIEEGRYMVAEVDGVLAASAGWTMRRPDYEARLGSAPVRGRPATIRAVFTDPAFAGRGLARLLMHVVETEAVLFGGADRVELCATLNGVGFYRRLGYVAGEEAALPLSNGALFRAVRMTKAVTGRLDDRDAA